MTENRLQNIKAALEDIGSAGDTARLQLHLLSMRARERTEQLATNIEAIEQRIDRNIEQAMQVAAAKTRQLSEAIRTSLGQVSEPGLTVSAIMTEPARYCLPEQPASAAAQIMWDHDCGAVPVVGDEGRVLGMITDRDLCMAAYTQGLPLVAIRVGDVMARPAHACRPDDSFTQAAELMARAQVRRLAVVDSEGRLVGMVSLADIAQAAPALGQAEAAVLLLRLVRAVSKRRPDVQQAAE